MAKLRTAKIIKTQSGEFLYFNQANFMHIKQWNPVEEIDGEYNVSKKIFTGANRTFQVRQDFSAVEIAADAKAAKLENARKALASAHIEKVEVGFEYEADGVRYYSAITKDSGIPRKYRVKVWEDSDGATLARCNCAAINECRHIGKVAKVDARKNERDVCFDSFGAYRAHESNKRSVFTKFSVSAN